MRVHQHAWHLRSINALLLKSFHDHVTGFPLIFAVDFFLGHFPCAGNRAVEIVRMSGPRGGNRLTRLRPDGCMTGMGVNNAANGGESLIQQAVRWGIGGGLFITFHHFTGCNTDNDHIAGSHYAVIDTGGFNHKHAALAIDSANVSPGQRHQVVLWQRQIRFQYLTFKIF